MDVLKIKEEPVDETNNSDNPNYVWKGFETVIVKQEPIDDQDNSVSNQFNVDFLNLNQVKEEIKVEVDINCYPEYLEQNENETQENNGFQDSYIDEGDLKIEQNVFDDEGNAMKLTFYNQHSSNSKSALKKKPIKNFSTFSCMYCNGHFVTKNTRDLHTLNCKKNHQRFTYGNDHNYSVPVLKCCICNCQFSSKIQLHNHKCGERRETPYKCDICNRQFSLKSCLINHSKIHKYTAGRVFSRN